MTESNRGLCVTGTAGRTMPLMDTVNVLELLGKPRGVDWVDQGIGIITHSLNLKPDGTRHFPNLTGVDMLEEVARRALDDAGIRPKRVGHMSVATCTPDVIHFEQDAIELARRLGLQEDTVLHQFDPGCAGFSVQMQTHEAFYRAGTANDRMDVHLVVAQNNVSAMFDPERYHYGRVRGSWVAPLIFGDAAAAMVWQPWEKGGGPALESVSVAYDGSQHLVDYPAGGAAEPTSAKSLERHVYLVDGPGVKESFVPGITKVWDAVREQHGLSVDDVALFLPHQANYRLLEACTASLGIPEEKWRHNVRKLANTVTPSTMLLYHEEFQARNIPDEPVVFLTIGAGTVFGGITLLPQE